jgi:hypothetical protein
MAIRPFNSIGGYSVGTNFIEVIDDVGNVSANNLTVTNLANLGAVSNITITGGSNGQVITTDGSGNLSFGDLSSSISPMPTLISSGTDEIIPENYQGLFGFPITIEGSLTIDGILVDVSGDGPTIGGSQNQIQFNNGSDDVLGASDKLTFDTETRVLYANGIMRTGQYANNALPDSVIGGIIFIVNGINKPAYGDGTGWYYFDTNEQVS